MLNMNKLGHLFTWHSNTLFYYLLGAFLLAINSVALACETEPMQGYEWPCKITTQFDPAGQYIYTRAPGSNTIKKWELSSGKVIEELESTLTPQYITPEDAQHDYPQSDDFVILAEARDRHVAFLSGKLGKIHSPQFLYDFENNKILWDYGSKYKKEDEKYYRASRVVISPDASEFTLGNFLYTVGQQGYRRLRSNHDKLYASQDFSAFYRIKKEDEEIVVSERLNPEDFSIGEKLDKWFITNNGFFPIDNNTAWVLMKYHDKDNYPAELNPLESKVAALYLVNTETGETLRSFVLDKREDPAKKKLREYIALKIDYSREQLLRDVEMLQTPEFFLLRERQYNFNLLGNKHLMVSSNSRNIIFDTESWKPKTILTPRGYKHTILSSFAPERQVEIREGLGSNPNYAYFYSPVWIEESQTFLAQSNADIYEFDLTGRTLAKRFENKELIGSVGGRNVIVAERNKKSCKKFEVRNIDTAEKIRSLKGSSEFCILALNHSGKYLFVDKGYKNNKYIYDTTTGKEIFKTKDKFQVAHDGILNFNTGEYTPFETLQPRKLAWKHRKQYDYKKIQGQYILSWAKDHGLEVFDIAENRYITPLPLDPGFYKNGFGNIGNTFIAYFPATNTVVIASKRSPGYGYSKTIKTGALGYSLDLTTYAMRPLAVHALPWDDPLVAIRDEERQKQKAAEQARRKAEYQRQQQLAIQEQSLMKQVETMASSYPANERIALFYPDGPLGPYVSNERKAQALVEHMNWWAQPNNHTSTYGLLNVPFAFVEEMIPYLPAARAREARSVLPTIRNKQLTDQKLIQQNADIQKMLDNFSEAVRSYQPPKDAPKTLNRHRASDYQEWHYLYGTGTCGSASNPCKAGDDTRAYQ